MMRSFYRGTNTSVSSLEATPTDIVEDKSNINPVEGIELVLYHAPGETNDQLMVWWPEKRILFPADNIYKVNTHAVRCFVCSHMA